VSLNFGDIWRALKSSWQSALECLLLMLWTAPPPARSAMDVGAVKAPTIRRSQTCKRSRQSVSISPSLFFKHAAARQRKSPAKAGPNSEPKRREGCVPTTRVYSRFVPDICIILGAVPVSGHWQTRCGARVFTSDSGIAPTHASWSPGALLPSALAAARGAIHICWSRPGTRCPRTASSGSLRKEQQFAVRGSCMSSNIERSIPCEQDRRSRSPWPLLWPA
jgi:hypothetical protein